MDLPDYLKQPIAEIDKKIAEAKELVGDASMAQLAQEELSRLQMQKKALMDSAKTTVSNGSVEQTGSDFNVCLMEFRAGPGGEEAKIWAHDLERLYTRFANRQNWQVEQLNDLVIRIKGKGCFAMLKFEAGVHRVQRIPTTEASGRIHTSTASVAVLPIIPESQIQIKPDDVEISFTHATGHGGQNINKVSTAVRLVHKPTGIIIESQTQRFQDQNRKIAMDILRSKLWELEEEKRLEKLNQARSVIGRAMRSEKIRTYNFPQDRVTDHRIKKSWHNLPSILNGNIDDITSDIQKILPSLSHS